MNNHQPPPDPTDGEPGGPPEMSDEVASDPDKRREWIEQNMPAGFGPGNRAQQVDWLNAKMEWMYQAAVQLDEMPEHSERLHYRRLVRDALELASDCGVQVGDPEQMGQLLYAFLTLDRGDDDLEEEPEPQPDPSEQVPA